VRRERPEHEPPNRFGRGDEDAEESEGAPATPSASSGPSRLSIPNSSGGISANAPAPAPTTSFAGLDFANWGQGHPPDTNGDVGPAYYIQTINVSLGIYDKSSGNRVAAFTFNSFMSQGNFGNLCDTNNFGDPVVLYDSFEDRWIITDFAFQVDGSGNVSPQHVFECFAVSQSGNPVTGGWNFYSVEAPGGLADYPKFGVWSDGIYMAANMFGYSNPFPYLGAHVWGFDKAAMYAGASSPGVVDFADSDGNDFTLLPANARLQTGTPPTGRDEYFVSTWEDTGKVAVYTLHSDWDSPSNATFSGPTYQQNATAWPNASVPLAPTLANTNDTLGIRAMAQAQYSNIGGNESLWVSHTVRRANTSGFAAPRWYQLNVNGGVIGPNTIQGTTWDADNANVTYRYMPSLAVDRLGDMALGYTSSNSTTNPRIDYAGRLAGDPVNTFSQGEQTLIAGSGSQSGSCGGTCHRWGDYSAMSLDPDGCRFWMTNEYYATTGLNHQTRIGAFQFPGCTTVGNGTLSGTVTRTGGAPIAGATVALGSRTTTTDDNGDYSFTVPAGTYPLESASKAGFVSASVTDVSVPSGGTATKDFSLDPKAGAFTGVSPFRLLDTRNGIGAPKAQVGAGQTVTFQVAGGGDVPSSGASAAALNLTVTKGTKPGFVTAYPSGSARPGTSNDSFAAGQTIATHTTVKLGPSDGKVVVFNGSSAPVDLIADVLGWYKDGSVVDPGMFTPLVGSRLANLVSTGANVTLPVQVATKAGIPAAAGVGAGAFNVTVTGPTRTGFITAFPDSTTRPNASNVNFLAGQTIANAATTRLVNGRLALFNGSLGTTKITADVSGWFKAGAATLPGGFSSVNPARILDTRNAIGAPRAQVPAGGTVVLTVANHGGVPSDGAESAVMNVTVTRPGASGFVTAFPSGTTRPNASNINFVAGQTIPNLVTVKLGTGGQVTFYNGATAPVDIIADVAGWYHG
jgi:hypothetical protein